ncbi:MAG: HDOD domain-containing protein, partial [Burkholderiales bacterium]
REGEEAVVCALLSRLGELVCVFYAPDEWQQIERKVANGAPLDEAAAAVLGISLTELGQATAARWGLPGALREALKPYQPTNDIEPLTHSGWLQAMAAFAGELARATAAGDAAAARAATERFAPVVAIDADIAHATLEALTSEAGTEGGWEGLAEEYFDRSGAETSGKPHDAEARLAAGVAEITRSAQECQFSILLHMALEVLKGSLGCARTIAFVLDPATRRYSARAGFGEPASGDISSLYFEGGFAPDVFHLTLSSKKPVHVADVLDRKIQSRIPAWHKNALRDARSLLLLPVIVNERAVALLYADWTGEAMVPLTDNEARLLRTMTAQIETAAQQGPLGAPLTVGGR